MTKHDWRRSSRKELCWLVAASVALGACGAGQPETVKAPPPKKVMWNDSSGSEPAAEEPEAAAEEPETAAAPQAPAEDEESVDDPNAIDLDALAAQQAKPAPAAAPKTKAAPPAKRATARAASKKRAPEPVAEEVAAEPEEQPETKPAEAKQAEAKPAEAKQPDTKKAEAKKPDSAAVAVDPLALELQKRRAAAKARAEARAGKDDKSSAKKDEPEAEEPAASAYKGNDPCRATSFSVDRVRSACANGGRAAAKRVMKDAIGKATATGQSLRCSNCHADQKDYTLKADAVGELKRWLDGSGG